MCVFKRERESLAVVEHSQEVKHSCGRVGKQWIMNRRLEAAVSNLASKPIFSHNTQLYQVCNHVEENRENVRSELIKNVKLTKVLVINDLEVMSIEGFSALLKDISTQRAARTRNQTPDPVVRGRLSYQLRYSWTVIS